MYNAYFGFFDSPFENNLDQRFLFLSEDHREILAALLYFAETKKGFAIVCGDVGTGKSMLINAFLDRLPESAHPIIILNPFVSSLDILIHIAKALKIRTTGNESVLDLTEKVKKALTSAKLQEKSFVLIVDEAHLLSDQALEEIRLLFNIETPAQKLLQILLVGQYELSHKLDRPEMRHLRQRINVNRFLSPLNPEESIQYVDHRLRQVGSSFAAVFEDQCRRWIFRLTEGCPRLINQLCDNALLICMTEGRRKVNRKVLEKAHEAWQTDLVFTPESSRARTYRGRAAIKPLVVVAGSVVMVLLGIMAIRGGWGVVNIQSVFQKIRAAIPTASEPQATSVTKSKDQGKPEKESPPLKKPREPEGAPAASLKPSGSAPKAAPLPEGFGRMEIKEPSSPVEPPALSPPGPSEMQPGTPGELEQAVETAPKKADPAEPQGAPSELGGTPQPSSEPGPAPPVFEQLVARGGESLTRIASQHYPNDPGLGIAALILQNPGVTKVDVIKSGEVLYLPKINFENRTIQLKDNLWYAFYGRYPSPERANKIAFWFNTMKIKFLERDIKSGDGTTIKRIFIGGYAAEEELTQALKSLSTRKQ